MALLLDEDLDENYEPTHVEIKEYAEWLGMDPDCDQHHFWIARLGLKAPLPSPWKPCQTENEEIFYFNFETGESIWDHPCDEVHRKIFQEAKEKTRFVLLTVIAEPRSSGSVILRCTALSGREVAAMNVFAPAAETCAEVFPSLVKMVKAELPEGIPKLVLASGTLLGEKHDSLTIVDAFGLQGQDFNATRARRRLRLPIRRSIRRIIDPSRPAASDNASETQPDQNNSSEHTGKVDKKEGKERKPRKESRGQKATSSGPKVFGPARLGEVSEPWLTSSFREEDDAVKTGEVSQSLSSGEAIIDRSAQPEVPENESKAERSLPAAGLKIPKIQFSTLGLKFGKGMMVEGGRLAPVSSSSSWEDVGRRIEGSGCKI